MMRLPISMMRLHVSMMRVHISMMRLHMNPGSKRQSTQHSFEGLGNGLT
jgi:hypothetical protein